MEMDAANLHQWQAAEARNSSRSATYKADLEGSEVAAVRTSSIKGNYFEIFWTNPKNYRRTLVELPCAAPALQIDSAYQEKRYIFFRPKGIDICSDQAGQNSYATAETALGDASAGEPTFPGPLLRSRLRNGFEGAEGPIEMWECYTGRVFDKDFPDTLCRDFPEVCTQCVIAENNSTSEILCVRSSLYERCDPCKASNRKCSLFDGPDHISLEQFQRGRNVLAPLWSLGREAKDTGEQIIDTIVKMRSKTRSARSKRQTENMPGNGEEPSPKKRTIRRHVAGEPSFWMPTTLVPTHPKLEPSFWMPTTLVPAHPKLDEQQDRTGALLARLAQSQGQSNSRDQQAFEPSGGLSAATRQQAQPYESLYGPQFNRPPSALSAQAESFQPHLYGQQQSHQGTYGAQQQQQHYSPPAPTYHGYPQHHQQGGYDARPHYSPPAPTYHGYPQHHQQGGYDARQQYSPPAPTYPPHHQQGGYDARHQQGGYDARQQYSPPGPVYHGYPAQQQQHYPGHPGPVYPPHHQQQQQHYPPHHQQGGYIPFSAPQLQPHRPAPPPLPPGMAWPYIRSSPITQGPQLVYQNGRLRTLCVWCGQNGGHTAYTRPHCSLCVWH
ncbi:hypothetical protein LTR22_020551 [Elasticomyces elasticus]|nr:hypothetical protein LTR22_020551 [Elasticomyces elasticus]KAK5754939.1 hypothetical protein LTS12_014972 [Elasticomyces elasticus]